MNTSVSRPALQLPLVVSAVVDAVLVLLFATIGRRSHDEGIDPLGIVHTAWPFLVGAAVGWSLMYVYAQLGSSDSGARVYRPERVLPFGVVVWVSTVAVGMALRAVLRAGTAPSFIVVATVTLAVFLLGWRAIAARLHRLRR
ncbi:DUF3054 domain-containing protein [Gordonia sp. (in: high G+C Gram-positive bacteria)]|uniref:DUF3054 domain-containing protein n=1 Tax=Gordonia sp. (in: high G+C Gram-positive bacteria) TaxID=84139 RepID=UPI0039E6E290